MAKPVSDLHIADDTAWRRVKEREPVIRRLAALARIPDVEMLSAMTELGLGRSQIHTLVGRYRLNSVASALLPNQPGPPPGHSKLLPAVEEVIERLIEQMYLTRQKPNVAALCRSIAHECRARKLIPPSRTAVTARIVQRPAAQTVRRRQGQKAAYDLYRPVTRSYEASFALQVVQIDHTPVDQIIVDERNRQPIGRPWMTLAIDVASRMVIGFYLTLEHPSAVSVAMTLRHAVLPKERWLAERGIPTSWPVAGIPDRLHMDNGKEFHSRALARGCVEYGIEQQFRPPAMPHYGGHIERLIGTVMGAVHLLPGTTFSNITEKGTYDPAATSAMTLSELEIWIANEIVGVYHARLHKGLGCTPNAAWEHALRIRSQPLRHPPDPHQFLLDFLPFEHRTVRRDGIRLFNISYWDPVLSTWIGEHLKMPVKYDPRDLSRVFLQAPDGTHWVIPYADLSRPAITLWEQKRAINRLRDAGRAVVDERLIFDTVEAQRALVADAKNRTLRARRTASRLANALDRSGTYVSLPKLIGADDTNEPDVEDTNDTYLPYPVEDWS